MSKYKITPTNSKNGNKAPYYVRDIEDENKVEEIAATLSPLFDFDCWYPVIERL